MECYKGRILPCRVILEPCAYLRNGKVLKSKFKKTKRIKINKSNKSDNNSEEYENEVAAEIIPNKSQTKNEISQSIGIKKVIFKKMGYKIIAVICKGGSYHKETTTNMGELHDNVLSSMNSHSSTAIESKPIRDYQSSDHYIEVNNVSSPIYSVSPLSTSYTVTSPPSTSSYTVTSFGKNPNKKQFYVNDVSLCSNVINTPLIKPQPEKLTHPTTSPMLNNQQLDISTHLFQGEIQDTQQTPVSSNIKQQQQHCQFEISPNSSQEHFPGDEMKLKRTPTISTQVDDDYFETGINIMEHNPIVEKPTSEYNTDKYSTAISGHDTSKEEDIILVLPKEEEDCISKDTSPDNEDNEKELELFPVPVQSNATRPMVTSNKFATSSRYINQREIDEKADIDETLFRVAESLLLLAESGHNSKFCVGCKKVVNGICSIHGSPMDSLPQTKALISLPATMSIQTSSLADAGLGVFSLVVFEIGSLFGPMDGEKLSHKKHKERGNNPYVWEVYQEDRSSVSHFLDCKDQGKSNWMRFVNCARFEEEQNLIAEQYDQLLFYKAYKKILPGQELLAWYGNSYGRELRDEFKFPINTLPIGGDDEYGIEMKSKRFKPIESKDSDLFVKCNHCSALFSSDEYLESHQKYACKLASNFRCDVCAKKFKSMLSLRQHKYKGHDVSKAFNCMLCSSAFTTRSNLTVHIKTHIKDNKYICAECGKRFSRGTFLRNHMSSVHLKERPYVCNICFKRFCRSDTLKRHFLLHGTERTHSCSLCGAKFFTLDSINMHMKQGHPSNKPMKKDKCLLCDEDYDDINGHDHYVHRIKVFEECSLCNRKILHANFQSHMSKHENPTKSDIQCPICKKYFKALNGHISYHTREEKIKANYRQDSK